LVAEGRIVVKPWINVIQDQSVRFDDGSYEEFDAIILGTGFHLSLPILEPGNREYPQFGTLNIRPLQIHISPPS